MFHFSKDYLGGNDKKGLERIRGKRGREGNVLVIIREERQEMKRREGPKEVTCLKEITRKN